MLGMGLCHPTSAPGGDDRAHAPRQGTQPTSPQGTKQALDSRQRQRPFTAQGDTSRTPVTWL